MVHMQAVQIMKRLKEQGKSERSISRETGHHRSTVNKYVNGGEVGYQRKKSYARPKAEAVNPLIEQWYQEDMKGPKKQKRTAQKMYDDLVKYHGYTGSYSTVKVLYRKIKGKSREVFVPRESEPGEYIEFDFGYIKACYKGKEVELCLHCYQLIYSNDIFVYVSESERQEALFYSHKLAFEYFDGIAQKVRYDNLSQAVKRILRGKLREESDHFRTFRELYGFEAEFCERGKGWQKGDVEGLVGYVRRNCFSPVPTISDLEECNRELSEWCKSLRAKRKVYGTVELVGERYEEERRCFRALPLKEIDVGIHAIAKANHYSLISVEGAFYSVPTRYAYHQVDIVITIKEVIASYKGEEIARHQRTDQKGRQIFDPLHYLSVYTEKPYTAINSKPIRQLPAIFRKFFECAYHKGYGTARECIKVLELLRSYSVEELGIAIEMAMSYEQYDVEGVKQVLIQLRHSSPRSERLDVSESSRLDVHVPHVALNRYNSLMQLGRECE